MSLNSNVIHWSLPSTDDFSEISKMFLKRESIKTYIYWIMFHSIQNNYSIENYIAIKILFLSSKFLLQYGLQLFQIFIFVFICFFHLCHLIYM